MTNAQQLSPSPSIPLNPPHPRSRLPRRLYGHALQWAFRRLYHEWAWSYDLVAATVSGGQWAHWITAVLPLLQPGPTLELGCGTGYLQRALALRGVPHAGLDRAMPMLRWARRKVHAAGALPRLVRGNALALPFPAAVFRNVVATFPAPYIFAPHTLREVRRVLVSGGQFIILDNGMLAGNNRGAALAQRIALQSSHPDPRPALLARHGFAVQEHWLTVNASQVWAVVGSMDEEA